MYRLRFVYSDGTDDFDYWDEIETFEKDFTDPVGLVSRFIKLVQDHPQIESYEIRDSNSVRFQSIYHFIMYHVDDFSYKWELMNSVHNATHWDSEYFDKFFAEANFEDIKTQVVEETRRLEKLSEDIAGELMGPSAKKFMKTLHEM